ncbi:MAG: FecCD family ABC transporter permease [Paraglaciecola chathamensis]
MNTVLFWLLSAVSVCVLSITSLCVGTIMVSPNEALHALFSFDPTQYLHTLVMFQRLPRVLIALFCGAVLACSGLVLQGLTRNPLASPSTLGINAGAMTAVLISVFYTDVGLIAQGAFALVGGSLGFLAAALMARAIAGNDNQWGVSLVLSGVMVTMLLAGIANAILLSDPTRRTEFLNWAMGNISHVYIERLNHFYSIGVVSLIVLLCCARPLSLLLLGQDKAASMGISVRWITRLCLVAVVLGASAAVAVCGPVAFIGLIVPHIVRPLIGARFTTTLPACALVGAALCLLADLLARTLVAPYILNTGLVMDLVGGVFFVWIVRRYYLMSRPDQEPAL